MLGTSSGAGVSAGIDGWCSMPGCVTWNEADSVKIGRPCWMPVTRRVVNERPSRTRSTS